jgi:pimeloyl-ACP methyl ester carboxylesterase
MATFESDGLKLVFDGIGAGDPILMVHGFAANRRQAWRAADWYDLFIDAGREAIAFDHRGHGESDAPHDPAQYGIGRMADDVIRLLDRLEIGSTDLIGHSMGARVALELLLKHPDRLRAVVLVGVGKRLMDPVPEPPPMVAAMRAAHPDDIEDETMRSFRIFADTTGNDREALAACAEANRDPLSKDALSAIRNPVMLLAAGRDELAGDPEPLAEAIPGCELTVLPGTTHHSILADPRSQDAVFRFLGLGAPPREEHRW